MSFDPVDEKMQRRAPRPRDAATLILVRRNGGDTEVLMGQRHEGMSFMPNKFVFPGGRLDAADMRIRAVAPLRPDVLAALTKGATEQRAQALAMAAIRETFEETGLLIGDAHTGRAPTRSAVWRSFFQHGVAPRLDMLDYVARAITPPYRDRRFDARFFMADASHIRIEPSDGPRSSGELLKLHWVTVDKARGLDLPTITRRVLDEIEARVAAPETPRPIPFFYFRGGKAKLDYL